MEECYGRISQGILEQNSGKISRTISKETLQEFLKRTMDDFLKESLENFRTKTPKNMWRKPWKIFQSKLGGNVFQIISEAIPGKLPGDFRKNFWRNSYEIFQRNPSQPTHDRICYWYMRTPYTQPNESMYVYGFHFSILFFLIFDFV